MTNVVQMRMPLGPRESTPELRASLRKASVKAVRDRLAEHSRISAKTWVYVGKELLGMKEAADQDGPKVFAGLFAKNAVERVGALRYPFSLAMGRMLISIASSGINTVNSESVPSSWGTLYHLSRLPAEQLAELIGSGAVHPMMTRAEAIKLAGRKKKSAAKPITYKRAYGTAKQLLLKIKRPERRAIAFLNLMRDCGITIKQLQEIKK